MDLLDLMRPPATVRRVDPDGHVVQGEPHETLRLREGWRGATIELHPSADGWMWSTCLQTETHGGGYKVGEKWGKFAATRDDALHFAINEMRERLARCSGDASVPRILAWLKGLR